MGTKEIKRAQNQYLTSFLNVAVTEKIQETRKRNMDLVDSEEEEQNLDDLKNALPETKPEFGMTREDAVAFWEDVPDEVAKFEYEVERAERQKAAQEGRNGGKWKRNSEQKRIEGSRTQNAWQFKRDRTAALDRPGERIPRYKNYYHRPGSDPRAPGPSMPEPSQGVDYSRGPGRRAEPRIAQNPPILKGKNNGRDSFWPLCGWVGALRHTNACAPPITFHADEQGNYSPIPLPGVQMEMGHTATSCPKYSRKAAFPCATCKRSGRVAFHRDNDCLEYEGQTQQNIRTNVNRARVCYALESDDDEAEISKN